MTLARLETEALCIKLVTIPIGYLIDFVGSCTVITVVIRQLLEINLITTIVK
jgi:hypothetical protein